MKKIFTQMFLVALMLVCSQVAGAQNFSGGTGTEADPFQIANAADLQQLSKDVAVDMNSYAGSFFVMTQDIDMEGVTDFDPIGNNFSGDLHPFSGSFDGQGHKIFNFKKEWEELGFVGIFGIIMNANIENLTLASSNIYGDLSVGGIVGVAMGDNVISNCHTAADVTIGVRKFYIAGICGGALVSGEKGTVIKDCTNGAKIVGCVGYSAGILGTNSQANCQILRCGNYGEISDDQLHVAGIVAHTKNGISIIDCYNTGKISMLAIEGAENARGGGILAEGSEVPAEENIIIKNCYNAGSFLEESYQEHAIYLGDYESYDNTFLTNCYYNSDMFAYGYDHSTQLTTDVMKSEEFVSMLNDGRTDDACWVIAEGVNNGYPVPTKNNTDTSIGMVEGSSMSMVYGAGVVTVANAEGAMVVVTDITGRTMAVTAADAQGNATVDMSVLPEGAYIVSANGKSIKVVK